MSSDTLPEKNLNNYTQMPHHQKQYPIFIEYWSSRINLSNAVLVNISWTKKSWNVNNKCTNT